MPTRGNTDNDPTFLQRVRNYYWTPGAPAWQNALRVGRAAITGPASLAGAARSATVGEIREAISDRFGNDAPPAAEGAPPARQQSNRLVRRVDPSQQTSPNPTAPRDNGVRGDGRVPGLQERGFGQSFASGQNSFAPLVGAFTGYGQFGTRNAYDQAAAGGPPVALAGSGVSRGRDGGGGGNTGGTGQGYSTGGGSGNVQRVGGWLPAQTGTRIVQH